MFDFKITADNGLITIIRAKDRATAIRLYCEAEGCSREYVDKHCRVNKLINTKGKRKDGIKV